MHELSARSLRVFLGIAMPPAWHTSLGQAQNSVSELVESRLTWTIPQNLHITIQFFGDIRASFVPQLRTCLASIPFEPFTISPGDVQCMPARGNPKFFVLHLKKGCDECTQLTQTVRERCQQLGMVLDTRLCIPHVTLARMKTCVATDCWKNARMAAKKLHWPEYHVDTLTLWTSELLPSGPEYAELVHFPAQNADKKCLEKCIDKNSRFP